MGEIRYFILQRVNEIRGNYGRSPLQMHEENSNGAQKHAQYVLEEMLKWGEHRFHEIIHFNPFYYGEYSSENMGWSKGNASLEQHINGILERFEKKRFEGRHFDNMLNSWSYMGVDVGYDSQSGLLVLVQRFS